MNAMDTLRYKLGSMTGCASDMLDTARRMYNDDDPECPPWVNISLMQDWALGGFHVYSDANELLLVVVPSIHPDPLEQAKVEVRMRSTPHERGPVVSLPLHYLDFAEHPWHRQQVFKILTSRNTFEASAALIELSQAPQPTT